MQVLYFDEFVTFKKESDIFVLQTKICEKLEIKIHNARLQEFMAEKITSDLKIQKKGIFNINCDKYVNTRY